MSRFSVGRSRVRVSSGPLKALSNEGFFYAQNFLNHFLLAAGLLSPRWHFQKKDILLRELDCPDYHREGREFESRPDRLKLSAMRAFFMPKIS